MAQNNNNRLPVDAKGQGKEPGKENEGGRGRVHCHEFMMRQLQPSLMSQFSGRNWYVHSIWWYAVYEVYLWLTVMFTPNAL